MVLHTSLETGNDNAWGSSAPYFFKDETIPWQTAGWEGGEANGTWERKQFIPSLPMSKLTQEPPLEQDQNPVFSHLSPKKQNAFVPLW